MLGQVCEYRRDQHRVIQPRLLNWIKRQVPRGNLRDSLFIYRHLEHNTFVVASWSRRNRDFQDIINIGLSLDNFTEQVAEQFRVRVRDTFTRHELIRILKQEERNKLTNMQEENDEEVDRREGLANENKNVKVSMSGAANNATRNKTNTSNIFC